MFAILVLVKISGDLWLDVLILKLVSNKKNSIKNFIQLKSIWVLNQCGIKCFWTYTLNQDHVMRCQTCREYCNKLWFYSFWRRVLQFVYYICQVLGLWILFICIHRYYEIYVIATIIIFVDCFWWGLLNLTNIILW